MTLVGTAASDRTFLAHLAPWDAQGLRVGSLRGRERLSESYRFDLRALTPEVLGPERLPTPGTPLTLALFAEGTGPQAPRFLHGILTRAQHHGTDHDREGSWLGLRLEPRLALLKYHRTRRIFQDRTLAQIADALLGAHRVPWRWAGELPTQRLPYTVQYDETDYAFLRRVLASFGVFFFFEQAARASGPDAHETLVLCDDARHYAQLAPVEGTQPRTLHYAHGDARARAEEALLALEPVTRARPTAVRLRDTDVRTPQQLPDYARAVETEPALGREALRLDAFEHRSGNGELHFRPLDARIALEQARADATEVHGTTDCAGLSAGTRFATGDHPLDALNARWVVTELVHEGRVSTLLPDAGAPSLAAGYANRFRAAPAERTVRPARPARVLRQVCERAVVVGPASEEVFTDALGRIKVQFPWDREGRYDEHSSCWVTVSQSLAGNGWGAQWIPRVGMEVLVLFVGGDPDHPVVVGCSYTGSAAPPFALPGSRTRGGLRTRSSPGGAGYNELSFEDAAGSEQVLLHAQRDLDEEVGRNRSLRVGANDTTAVEGDQTLGVGGDRVERVAGALERTVGADAREQVYGNLSARVGGTSTLEVGEHRTVQVQGNALHTVAGNCEHHVEGRHTVHVEGDTSAVLQGSVKGVVGGKLELDVGGSSAVTLLGGLQLHALADLLVAASEGKRIELRVGDSAIVIDHEQILVESPRLVLRGRDGVLASGENSTLRLKNTTTVTAEHVRLNARAARLDLEDLATLEGTKVKLGRGAGERERQNDRDRETNETPAMWRFRVLLPGPSDVRQCAPLANARFVATGHGPEAYEGVSAPNGVVEIPRVYPRCAIRLEFEQWEFVVAATDEPPSEERAPLEALHRLGYGEGSVDTWSDEKARQYEERFSEDHAGARPEHIE